MAEESLPVAWFIAYQPGVAAVCVGAVNPVGSIADVIKTDECFAFTLRAGGRETAGRLC